MTQLPVSPCFFYLPPVRIRQQVACTTQTTTTAYVSPFRHTLALILVQCSCRCTPPSPPPSSSSIIHLDTLFISFSTYLVIHVWCLGIILQAMSCILILLPYRLPPALDHYACTNKSPLIHCDPRDSIPQKRHQNSRFLTCDNLGISHTATFNIFLPKVFLSIAMT